MNQVAPGRFTADVEGSFVVFVIGMRVNRWWAVHKWVPVAQAMGPMLTQLMRRKELGLLHAEPFLYWPGIALIQYWRSFEHLERFARDAELAHLGPWRRFNQAVGADGSVGIWHETYLVEAGRYECIYANMPRFGLARAGTHVPVVGARDTAKGRVERTAVDRDADGR